MDDLFFALEIGSRTGTAMKKTDAANMVFSD